LQDVGFEIVEERRPSFLFDGALLVTGEVDRTTGYEPGFPVQDAWRNDHWEPDPLVLDDQAVIVNVRERGLVVLTGCGHAGIVNISRYALALTGASTVYGLFGGFHLNGPLFEPLIPRVCADLAELQPSVVVPAHCTGWRAQHVLAATFGEAYVPDCVGTRFTLRPRAHLSRPVPGRIAVPSRRRTAMDHTRALSISPPPLVSSARCIRSRSVTADGIGRTERSD
jgi:7,8-dihydropterin-6-yl-methyl-4-(beta-D-ribofuranosyl)aminobenzene 5'-phosphate synthase